MITKFDADVNLPDEVTEEIENQVMDKVTELGKTTDDVITFFYRIEVTISLKE